jgi:hypothetical protein
MDMDHVANKRRKTEEEVRTSPFDLAMTTADVFGCLACMGVIHWHHAMCYALAPCNVCVHTGTM